MTLTVNRPDEALPAALDDFAAALKQRVDQSELGDSELDIEAEGGGTYDVDVKVHGGTAYEVDESGEEPSVERIAGRRTASEMTQDVMDEYFTEIYPRVYADDTTAEISFTVNLPDDAAE